MLAVTSEDQRLKVQYPKPRFALSKPQLLAGAVVMAVIAAVLLLQPREDPLQAPAEVDTQPYASEEAESEIVVSIVGAVEQPGLATLAPGARVADALALAKPQADAELAAVNLAQKLVDAQQLTIPRVGEAPVVPPGPAAPVGDPAAVTHGKISINSATSAELEQLSGVGAKTAAAIIAYRQANGGFRSIDELQQVKGIGPAKFEQLRAEVTL
ncbi:ComEA family DNA-binding protein [Corynebacterium gerontici]|uniref:ComE operon protein 1 n=1 Tax=Corynebacterium gerontici TaxID=2079234 RepID=A0A3G6J1L7_9CORY|nr:ComE operon protein 1 [Corynebacterium gerontici]